MLNPAGRLDASVGDRHAVERELRSGEVAEMSAASVSASVRSIRGPHA